MRRAGIHHWQLIKEVGHRWVPHVMLRAREGATEPGENWPQARQELSLWAFRHRVAVPLSKDAAIIRAIIADFEMVIGKRKSSTCLLSGCQFIFDHLVFVARFQETILCQ